MSTITTERTTTARPTTAPPMTGRATAPRPTWTCENCQHEIQAARKRCTECGTSRF